MIALVKSLTKASSLHFRTTAVFPMGSSFESDIKESKTSIRQAAQNSCVSVSFLRRLPGGVALDSTNGQQPVFS